MPLGWVPRGLSPKPALVEITTQNQNRFQTTMFPNAKPYLIVHAILGILLMMMIIKGDSPWSITERWIGAALLWHQIINWSGILESKPWLFISENIRIILTVIAGSTFSFLSVWLMIIFTILALGSLFWCWQYFRVNRLVTEL
jgi:alkylglycerol monooxygenase